MNNIKADSGFRFSDWNLQVETRIFRCQLVALYDEQERYSILFSSLKQNGFSFDANNFDGEGNFLGDNYANYSLDLLDENDFFQQNTPLYQRVSEYLGQLFSSSDSQSPLAQQYTNTVLAALNFYIPNGKAEEFRELNIAYLEKHKRHWVYSLWQHFISFIIVPVNNPDFVYIQIGFD